MQGNFKVNILPMNEKQHAKIKKNREKTRVSCQNQDLLLVDLYYDI